MTKEMRNGRIDRATGFATAAALALTAASWLGGTLWLMELLTHFRFQFAAGGLVLMAVAIARRRPAVAAAATLVLAANSLPLLPYAMPVASDAHAGEARLRIMAANVRYSNRDYERAMALIAAENPDVVGLLEVTDAWIDGLSGLRERYPYRVIRPDEGAHGLALFSRVPIEELGDSPYREADQLTAIRVRADLPGRPAILTLAHLIAPTTPKRHRIRNRQIRTIAGMVATDGEAEHIVIGDLNITPWSPHYAALQEAGLANAARGRGYTATWPAVLGPLGIPIDHVLLSAGLHVQQFRSGASFGSDHLPIVADVALPPAPVH
jgi:endonuclease/exonuclease/phosphatase (EEP) superfamily protein YafD